MTEAVVRLTREGLWTNNPGLVQLLGLCPLLAVSNSVINALGLGLATLLVLVLSNTTVSLIRHGVRREIRIPVFVLVIASFVTVVELSMNAWFHELYLVLGIFIPLIVTNCAILGRAEAYASRNPPGLAAFDGLMMGLGFAGVLLALGAFRELLAQGTLLNQAELMFGPAGEALQLTVLPGYDGFLLAALPPGAFIGLGLLLALKNLLDQRRAQPRPILKAARPGQPG
ncbi:MAG: electron transport complex subunit E [Ectothiorhodospiraceae bacterium]|nr:electron transport complex subunit E [Ectothiorhodospiraceae bacterium]